MSILTSLGILVLSVLACSFLQIAPSVFAIFYHYASAKGTKEKTLDLSSYFLIGSELINGLLIFVLYFIVFEFLNDNPFLDLTVFEWIAAGIVAALGIFIIFFYYRKDKKGTALFIPRKTARSLMVCAKTARKKSDIVMLGIVSGMTELVFSLPIYLITVTEIIRIPGEDFLQPFLLFLFIILTMLPIMTMRGHFWRGKNLAEIERSREKNKNFSKVILGSVYVLLAISIILFRIFA